MTAPAWGLKQRGHFRTPRLDLDSVYGRGPDEQPYMYVGKKFRLGRALFELDKPSKSRDLPRFDDPQHNPANLAQRNLLRGMAMALPSGQDVARAMGLAPIADDNLRVCKAVLEDWDDPHTARMSTFHHGAFKGKAPLWYYGLAEAMYEWVQRAKAPGSQGGEEPVRLGAVGRRIVAETLIGLLWADGYSYLRQVPNWKPEDAGIVGPNFNMGALIKFALS